MWAGRGRPARRPPRGRAESVGRGGRVLRAFHRILPCGTAPTQDHLCPPRVVGTRSGVSPGTGTRLGGAVTDDTNDPRDRLAEAAERARAGGAPRYHQKLAEQGKLFV